MQGSRIYKSRTGHRMAGYRMKDVGKQDTA
jgi:hypothetical protein